jgi:hypothetical protein
MKTAFSSNLTVVVAWFEGGGTGSGPQVPETVLEDSGGQGGGGHVPEVVPDVVPDDGGHPGGGGQGPDVVPEPVPEPGPELTHPPPPPPPARTESGPTFRATVRTVVASPLRNVAPVGVMDATTRLLAPRLAIVVATTARRLRRAVRSPSSVVGQ